MGTPIQDVVDAFTGKADEDFTGKEGLIFQYLKSACAMSYKYVAHSLKYTANMTTYEGNFDDTLDDDEIELLSLQMLYRHKSRKKEPLEGLQKMLGTKDFNNLPDKVRELQALNTSLANLKIEIDDFKQEFNTYKYN